MTTHVNQMIDSNPPMALRELTISVRMPQGYEPAGGWEMEEAEGAIRQARNGDLYLSQNGVLKWRYKDPSQGVYLILRKSAN